MSYIPLVLSALVHITNGLHNTKFPHGFMFGAATSAYQIEGAWNESDKGQGMWDKMIHERPEMIVDRSNGDVTCDSYHQWRQDVHAAHNLNLDFYRFSISWPRLLPTGFSNVISKDGVKYYNNLIDGLLEKNIKPFITLYHFDLPQKLQDLGGWTNPMIVDWFEEYAGVVFKLFADRVKLWITINEPNIMCDYNYNTGIMPPAVKDPDTATYLCNKHVLLAHAKVWRLYDREYKPKYHGIMSIVYHVVWMEAASVADEELSELARQFAISRFAHPILSKDGGWPPVIERRMADNSKEKGYASSRLPPFTREERLLVRGTSDYVAVNYYTSRLVRKARPGDDPGIFFVTGIPELGIILEQDPEWPNGGHSLVPSYPKGLRLSIAWMRNQYGNQNFFITETGYADLNSEMDDYNRVDFYRQHLEQVLHSIHDDGANITGFTAWSLIDNFEWMAGYTLKYGLYHTDFNDPKRRRTPKDSAHFYADVISSHSLDPAIVKKHLHRKKHKQRQAVNGSQIKADSCLFSVLALAYTAAKIRNL